MQFYLISDNIDTQMGMRLAGIPGVVVHEPEETEKALREAMDNENTAVVLITEKLFHLIEADINEIKLSRPRPLVVEIPDRHASESVTSMISRYVEEAIGIKI
ncbi:MAG: V-type ATP synthase subunit F [Oscillospiraceae bacterium]|nr:V-type ATP synthase subunit F [Oscillospiraceae bacterium]